MQDRYTGDIGDFVKYAILRNICKQTNLRLGVNWYLVPDEEGTNDGRLTGYLFNDRHHLRELDPDLYDTLKDIVATNNRRVSEVEKRGVLPPSTLFYNTILSYTGIPINRRVEYRTKWARGSLNRLKDADIVFPDPDNGIEVQAFGIMSQRAIKYVYYNEIIPYWNRGQSLIVYNHRSMQKERVYLRRFCRCAFRCIRHLIPVLSGTHFRKDPAPKTGSFGTLSFGAKRRCFQDTFLCLKRSNFFS